MSSTLQSGGADTVSRVLSGWQDCGMDPVTALVISAIVTGAAAGAGDTAKQAVKDAYAGLKNLITHKYRDVDVTAVERKPDSEPKKASLAEDLADAGAATDSELAAAAAAVLDAVREHAPQMVVGLDVNGLKAEALNVFRVVSTGDGVRVTDTTVTGPANFGDIVAGFGQPGPPSAQG
jgi:hypothetical protein